MIVAERQRGGEFGPRLGGKKMDVGQAAPDGLGLQPPASRAVADESRVAAVINHLIQNATEAAGADGKVEVNVARADGMVIFEVADDGPGMDAVFIQNQLFRPFNSTKETGYGIGAYQCRELVKEMKGYLEVNSVPGQGTTMRVSLPAAVPQTRVTQVAANS